MTDTNPSKNHSTEAEKKEDFLGYDVYADTLWHRVTLALDKDKNGNKDGKTPLGDDPLVIGIFGEWGSGKSKLLQMMLKRAKEQSKKDIVERKLAAISEQPLTVTVPVYFQPWKYEHERHLHVPMAVHVADALQEAWKNLPTDMEQLRQYIDTASETAEAAEKKFNQVKEVFEKSKRLWDAAVGAMTSRAGAVVAGTTDIMLTSVGVPPVISIARQKIVDATSNDEETEESAEKGERSKVEKPPAATAKVVTPAKDPWAWKDDGLGFYRMHRQLKALTRPKLDQKILEKAGIKATQGIEFDLRINFVVFIDDLDRCLPEKAVEALELIKTVFCLESFAFVIALDEEVVERGIGHRYQAYLLKDRKPEMPITGFEYLEKIVHLPFRLPALTTDQAKRFVREYETQRQSDGTKRWFAPEWSMQKQGENPEKSKIIFAERGLLALNTDMDLLQLAIDGFDDVFVPRKLIRMVELMHQTAAVAQERGESMGWGNRSVDVRVVLAILLIQLFQPELYRLMRRRKTAFSSLLLAFSDNGADKLDSADVSDHDLRQWALYSYDKLEDLKEPSQRMAAEQVRLPLVEQIGQYRRAQRHGFNVLMLMQSLAKAMNLNEEQLTQFRVSLYFSLLGEAAAFSPPAQPVQETKQTDATEKTDTQAPADGRPRHAPRDVQALFQSLVSPDQAVQSNLAEAAGLPDGCVLQAEAAKQLLEKVKAWQAANQSDLKSPAILLRGLKVLAPYIAHTDGKAFWELVQQDNHGGYLGEPLQSLDQLRKREAWADLRSTLGQDDRFEPAKPWICKERFKAHKPEQEPIRGFVKIPRGNFQFGYSSSAKTETIARDFYIARYLTTVAQYARFVDKGYDLASDYWDEQGRRLLESEKRIAPQSWAAQLPHATRPVTRLNWYEARAYCRWLNDKLQNELDFPKGYVACLPIEAQWERSARALANGTAHSYSWVWGLDGNNPELKANTYASEIGQACVVGLFPENELGVADLAGNLWEWQDNLFNERRTQIQLRVIKDQLLADDKRMALDHLSVRGGSWNVYDTGDVGVAVRSWARPSGSYGSLGFRVALSLD
jgi:formylglycine-generating enzyme required for sulfatase activity/ABC-type dipeptide/oligopeptide/nickel transport system ATPase subunit